MIYFITFIMMLTILKTGEELPRTHPQFQKLEQKWQIELIKKDQEL